MATINVIGIPGSDVPESVGAMIRRKLRERVWRGHLLMLSNCTKRMTSACTNCSEESKNDRGSSALGDVACQQKSR
jgi:hypothetical protein